MSVKQVAPKTKNRAIDARLIFGVKGYLVGKEIRQQLNLTNISKQ